MSFHDTLTTNKYSLIHIMYQDTIMLNTETPTNNLREQLVLVEFENEIDVNHLKKCFPKTKIEKKDKKWLEMHKESCNSS
ncbi:hypothetical protein N9K77_01595 [bacterium]|nr:hypothetical protein [bacterium]